MSKLKVDLDKAVPQTWKEVTNRLWSQRMTIAMPIYNQFVSFLAHQLDVLPKANKKKQLETLRAINKEMLTAKEQIDKADLQFTNELLQSRILWDITQKGFNVTDFAKMMQQAIKSTPKKKSRKKSKKKKEPGRPKIYGKGGTIQEQAQEKNKEAKS